MNHLGRELLAISDKTKVMLVIQDNLFLNCLSN